jgi:hypothetical protein
MRRFAPRLVFWALAFSALPALAGLAETKSETLEATDIGNHPFSFDFAAGGRLQLRVRSAEVRVVGGDEDRISVELSGRKARDAKDVKARFRREEGGGYLKISGGPHNDLTITVRVPSKIALHARIPFGEVHVENVTGDQDIELHAGDLTVDVGDPASYENVDASVFTGELDAQAFDEEHGGLFRSFRWTGTGSHRLHAHVGAGQLTLR